MTIKVTITLPLDSKQNINDIRKLLGPETSRSNGTLVGYKITRGIDYYIQVWSIIEDEWLVGSFLKSTWQLLVDGNVLRKELRGKFYFKVENV